MHSFIWSYTNNLPFGQISCKEWVKKLAMVSILSTRHNSTNTICRIHLSSPVCQKRSWQYFCAWRRLSHSMRPRWMHLLLLVAFPWYTSCTSRTHMCDTTLIQTALGAPYISQWSYLNCDLILLIMEFSHSATFWKHLCEFDVIRRRLSR